MTFDDLHNRGAGEPYSIITSEIDRMLNSLGYAKDTHAVGATPIGWYGLYKDTYNNYSHIHFTADVVRYYKEYACGGELNRFTMDVPPEALESPEAFQSFMSRVFDRTFAKRDKPRFLPSTNRLD